MGEGIENPISCSAEIPHELGDGRYRWAGAIIFGEASLWSHSPIVRNGDFISDEQIVEGLAFQFVGVGSALAVSRLTRARTEMIFTFHE